jgi:ketosteroid isomerase-like protein
MCVPHAPTHGFDVEAFYQSYWRALGSGDDAGASLHYTDDVVLRMPGDGAFAGEYAGRETALAAIERLHEVIYGYDVTLVERFTDEKGFALILDERPPGEPDAVAFRRLHVYLLRGERIAEINVFAGHCADPAGTSWWR